MIQQLQLLLIFRKLLLDRVLQIDKELAVLVLQRSALAYSLTQCQDS